MDVGELSAILQMQNETQQLLQNLQNKRSEYRHLLTGSKPASKPNAADQPNYLSRSHLEPGEQPTSTELKVAYIQEALTGGSKLRSYRKVTPGGEKPGTRNSFKLAQGIENGAYQLGQLDSEDKENHLFENGDENDDGKANTSVTFEDECTSFTLASTPKHSSQTLRDTPKSILKRRKIIDDNVRVHSKFPHTPTTAPTPKGSKGLNYSYSEEDYETEPKVPYSSDDLNGSYTEDSRHVSARQTNVDVDIEGLVQERLILDSGNDRQNAGVVLELGQRPKSFIFESAIGLDDHDGNGSRKEDMRQNTEPKSSSSSRKPSPSHSTSPTRAKSRLGARHLPGKQDQALLGYDWIAGVLDSESSIFGQPDDYFHEINSFRKNNKSMCAGDDLLRRKLNPDRPISPEIQDPGHQCLHGYTVNERLFTEPMNKDEDGKSACPVCLISRTSPTQQSPAFVRVSIPRSTLETPYRVKPQRRRSFDSTDTYALSKHCMAGYECSLPTTVPTAKNIDLKGANGIRGKQAMSLKEAENFVKSHSRTSQTFNTSTGSRVTSGNSRLGNSTLPGSQRQVTDTLLNMSHGLRYDLQDLARRRGKDRHRAPHSTEYPVM